MGHRYKAVFIDMDGTLLNDDHTISDLNKNVIKSLLDKGIIVVPISARPLHGILPVINQVVPADMPVVSLNGGYIFHNNEIIYQAHIPLAEVNSIHRDLENFDVSVMYYSQMEWFAALETALIQKEQLITEVKVNIQPFENTLAGWSRNNSGPNKILIAGDEELISGIEQLLLIKYKVKLNIFKSQACYLEVMSLRSSKMMAIEFLIAKFGIQRGETVAIGDNFNDVGMIEYAGIGVAMGNAPAEVKRKADYVTDTNNNDGVARALQCIFELTTPG